MYFDSLENKDCNGCTTCYSICPRNAIEMKVKNGFYYPDIDPEKCIHCDLCRKNCQKVHSLHHEGQVSEIYYGFHSNQKERWESTSGGAFIAIVNAFVKEHKDAWVYGAVYDEVFVVRHKGTQEHSVIKDMCRSKYIQSDMRGVYREILEHLKSQQYVLFSGTPCQVSGLKALAGNYQEYLLCVDFICHGVSNPEYFQNYIEALEKKHNRKIKSYSFRNKKKSAFGSSIRLVRTEYEDGQDSFTDRDLFVMSYKFRMFYRESCYNCQFASMDRCADITMGDFWGIENEIPKLKSERVEGLSMVMFNTQKSLQWKEKIAEYFVFHKYDGDFSRYQYLFLPTRKPDEPRKPYSAETDFLVYLRQVISPKKRWVYTHPKFIRRIGKLRAKIRILIKK